MMMMGRDRSVCRVLHVLQLGASIAFGMVLIIHMKLSIYAEEDGERQQLWLGVRLHMRITVEKRYDREHVGRSNCSIELTADRLRPKTSHHHQWLPAATLFLGGGSASQSVGLRFPFAQFLSVCLYIIIYIVVYCSTLFSILYSIRSTCVYTVIIPIRSFQLP